MTSDNSRKSQLGGPRCSATALAPGLALILVVSAASAQITTHKPPTGAQNAPALQPQATQVQDPRAQPHKNVRMSPAEMQKELLSAHKTMGPKVPNPHAASATANNMIALLKKQMQAGTTERSQITSAPPSVSQITMGSSTPSYGNAPAGTTRSLGGNHGTITTVSLPPDKAKIPPNVQAIPEPCQQGKLTMFTINGAAPQAVVFTTDPQYNLYTIKGCHFGAQQGQLFLIGYFKTTRVFLNVAYWSDGQIFAAMDANLTGEPDETNKVKLFLVRPDGQQLEIDGASFYAVRQSVTIATIPQSWATLGTVKDVSGTTLLPQYQTGTPDTSSVTVRRYSGDRFSGGQDYFDFSRLNPQFSLDNMQLVYLSGPDTCANTSYMGDNTIYIDGYPSAQWDGNGIRVNLGGITCHNSDTGDRAISLYTLQVQATGPRGVDPTAQP